MDVSRLTSLGWSDIELEGLQWEEAGRDLVLRLREPSAANTGGHRTIVCKWAIALNINLRSAEGMGGMPFTWDGAIKNLPDGRFSVDLDFASSGHLRLICSDIDVR